MQMINEITVMQQNKNIFNKILAGLNKFKKREISDYRISYSKTIDNKSIGIKFPDTITMWYSTSIRAVPNKIIMVQENNMVYFCITLTKQIELRSSYYNDTEYESNDKALDLIRFYRDKYYKPNQNIFDENGIQVSSNDDYIRSTKLYKDLSEAVNKIMDMKINFILKKDVPNLTKLSQRENILPLVIYDIKKDEFKYPYLPPSNSRSKVMNTVAAQHLARSGGDIDMVCSEAFRYASVRYWCSLDVKLPGPNFYFR